MRLLRQRARPLHIAFLQRRARTLHIVADLSHRLLLLRVQRAICQLFQLAAGRAQQPFRVLALAGSFRGSHAGHDLCGGLARSALANDNLPRTTIRCWRRTLAAFPSARRTGARRTSVRRTNVCRTSVCRTRARRTSIGLFCRRARRRFFTRRRRGLCRNVLPGSGRSRSLSSGIRGAARRLLLPSHSSSRETQPKRNRESTGKSHNGPTGLFPTVARNARRQRACSK